MATMTVPARRITAVLIVAVLLGAAIAVMLLVRGANRAEFIAQARVDGLAAHTDGNYEMALGKLGFYVRRAEADTETLLAFADARSRVFATNNRHLPHAAQIFLTALDREPHNREALEGLLRIYEQLGWRMEWMGAAKRMEAIDPNHIDALRLIAHGHYIESAFDRSSPYIDRLIEVDPENIEWRNLKLHVLRQQNATVEEQLAMCRQWMDEHRGDGRYHALKAMIMANAGEVSRARAIAREAINQGGGAETEQALAEMLRVLTALQMEPEAAALLDQTKRRHPDDLWPHERSVQRLWQLGRIAEALEEIDAIVGKHQSLNPGLLQHKCMLLLAVGQVDRAAQALSELEGHLQAAHPEQRDAARGWMLAMRARLDIAVDDWRAARNQYYSALGLNPGSSVIHFFIGEAYTHLEEHELASMHFERASHADPQWLTPQIAYLHSQLAAGYPRLAWQRLLRIIERGAAHPYLYVLLAEAWLAADEPHDQLPLRGLGGRGMQTVHLVDVLERLHDRQPQVGAADVLVRVAMRYGRAGKREVAHQVIEQTLASGDAEADLLVALARTSMNHGLGYEQALIDQAKARHGLTPELAAVMARQSHLQGNTDEGLKVIDAAFADQRDMESKIARLRLRAAYLAECYDGRTSDALAELFIADPTAVTAGYVLSYPAVWADRALAERAIDALVREAGEQSPRVAIARAMQALHSHTDDAARVAQAQVLLSDVLRVSPDSPTALNLMAELSLAGDGGQRDGAQLAIRHLERAVAAHPNRAEFYIRLIRLLQQQGDFAGAQTHLEHFAELAAARRDLFETHLQLLKLQGRYDQVANLLSQSVDETSTEAERVRLVQSLRMAGEHEQAERMLQNLLDSPQRGERTVMLAADFHAAAGESDKGLTLLESSPFECENHRQIVISDFLYAAGRSSEAIDRLQTLLRSDAHNVQAISRLAAIYAQSGDARGAFNTAIRGLSIDRGNEDLRLIALTTGSLLGEGERNRVREMLGDVAEGEPTAQVVHLLEQAIGETTSRAALAAAREIVDQQPDSLLAWRAAIALHVQAGAIDEALRLAHRSAAALPHLAEPARLAAELHAQSRHWHEALEMGRLWRQRSQHRPYEADVFISGVLLALDQPQQAAATLDSYLPRMIAQREREPQPLRNWISATLLSGDVERALQHVEELLIEPGPWQGQWLESSRSIPLRAAEEALAAIEPHLLHDARGTLTLASAWSEHAARFDDADAYARSDDLVRRMVGADEDLALAGLLIQAQNAQRRLRFSEAEEHYRQALSIQPRHVVGLNNLAALLLKNEDGCAEAMALSEQAVALAGDLPEVHHTHARALLCMEQFDGAERSARRALRLRDDSAFHVTLGLALALQSRTAEAARSLADAERGLEMQTQQSLDMQMQLDRLRTLVREQGDESRKHMSVFPTTGE